MKEHESPSWLAIKATVGARHVSLRIPNAALAGLQQLQISPGPLALQNFIQSILTVTSFSLLHFPLRH